jgi:hypothetical protein
VVWTELRVLIVDTGRVWWRLLPMIMGVYLFGWLGSVRLLKPPNPPDGEDDEDDDQQDRAVQQWHPDRFPTVASLRL